MFLSYHFVLIDPQPKALVFPFFFPGIDIRLSSPWLQTTSLCLLRYCLCLAAIATQQRPTLEQPTEQKHKLL